MKHNKVRSLLRYRQWSVNDGITTVTDKTMSRFKVRAAIKAKRARRWREHMEAGIARQAWFAMPPEERKASALRDIQRFIDCTGIGDL